MPRTNGKITRKNILKVAEKLFSEYGYDATGVDLISKKAGINKATIYYHFKDKQEIIISLFNNIIIELDSELNEQHDDINDVKDKIRKEIAYLATKKDILSIIMMESLKSKNFNDTLFKCAAAVIKSEKKKISHSSGRKLTGDDDLFMIHEFFTGFMPLVNFVVFRGKWEALFGVDEDKTLDNFISVFEKSHLNSHIL